MMLISVLVLASCAPAQTEQDTGDSTARGPQSLDISFVEGAPPDTVYVEQGENPDADFQVAVDIDNVGGFPESRTGSLNGKLYLTGYDSYVIQGGSWDGGDSQGNQFNRIPGISDDYPEGDSMRKRFTAETLNFPFDSERHDIPLRLKACYYYESHISGSVCVDPDPARDSDSDVCNVGQVDIQRQSGPLEVSSISSSGTSSELILTIEIQNRGRGEVLREFKSASPGPVTNDECLGIPEYHDDRDRVGVVARITGLGQPDCSPKGTPEEPLRLIDGRGEIVCRYPLEDDQDATYMTEFDITLQYGYMQTEAKDITLINLER